MQLVVYVSNVDVVTHDGIYCSNADGDAFQKFHQRNSEKMRKKNFPRIMQMRMQK